MIYLATPYHHKKKEVMQQRYERAMQAVYWHMRNGTYLYSPILYCHPLSIEYKLPKDASFWEQFDNSFIYPASAVWFYLGEGWQTSKGMKREYATAVEWRKPIYTLHDMGVGYSHHQLLQPLYKDA